MIRIGMIGYGYWGPNLMRTFQQQADASVVICCDADAKARKKAQTLYPETQFTGEIDDVLRSADVDAVVIALPVPMHADISIRALKAGKHVFVEKPLSLTAAEARRVVAAVEKTDRILMVGHLLMYHPAVDKLKSLIDNGELGKIHYAYSHRLNLGIVRSNENALWSLAPHDISVIMYLFGETPSSVTAMGQDYLQKGIEDTVFLHMKFRDRRMAHIHVSWLDPHRMRRLTVVGEKKMVVFDDVEPQEKVRVYDKGVDASQSYANYGESLTLRFGDINIPKIDTMEPLRSECRHFIDAIVKKQTPRSDHKNGLAVVRVLDAAEKSLRKGGAEVRIHDA